MHGTKSMIFTKRSSALGRFFPPSQSRRSNLSTLPRDMQSDDIGSGPLLKPFGDPSSLKQSISTSVQDLLPTSHKTLDRSRWSGDYTDCSDMRSKMSPTSLYIVTGQGHIARSRRSRKPSSKGDVPKKIPSSLTQIGTNEVPSGRQENVIIHPIPRVDSYSAVSQRKDGNLYPSLAKKGNLTIGLSHLLFPGKSSPAPSLLSPSTSIASTREIVRSSHASQLPYASVMPTENAVCLRGRHRWERFHVTPPLLDVVELDSFEQISAHDQVGEHIHNHNRIVTDDSIQAPDPRRLRIIAWANEVPYGSNPYPRQGPWGSVLLNNFF